MVLSSLIATALYVSIASAGQGDVAFAQPYFASIPSSLGLLSDQSFDFRYRKLSFDPDQPSETPTRITDGVERLEYLDTGVLTYDLRLVDRTDDAEFGEAMLERTFYSFVRGEYARATRLGGGSPERVMIGRWRGLPHMTYLALGLLGPEAAIDAAEFRGLRELPDGTNELTYILEDGKTLTLRVEPAPPGKLLSAQSRASDDAWQEVIYFENHVDGVGGLPARPTRVISSRVKRDGTLSSLTVWQSIERLDPATINHRVGAKSLLANLCVPAATAVEYETDRAMTLEELLSAPQGIVQQREPERVELDVGALDARLLDREGRLDSRMIAVLGGGIFALAMFLHRRRTT